MNKLVQDLKMETEAITKTQMEVTLEMGTLGNRTGSTDTNITNRTQEMGERIIKEMVISFKENSKSKSFQPKSCRNFGK